MSDSGAIYRQAVTENQMVDPSRFPSFEELSEDFPDDDVPLLDRREIDESGLTPEQRHWRDHGYVVLPGAIPESVVDAYLDLRERTGVGAAQWGTFAPYLYFEEMRDICCHPTVASVLRDLIGERMGLHFNLAAFKSTERGWHQDDYLNPPETHSWYAACWFALGDIHPDCGPFEFVSGSHKWACMRSHLVKPHLKPEVRDEASTDYGAVHWAAHAVVFTTPAYEQKLADSGSKVESFLGSKGDVLIWHGKLLHRGSVPNDRSLERPALIAHYSSVERRTDLGPHVHRHGDGGWYWAFPDAQLHHNPDPVTMDRQMRVIHDQRERIAALERRIEILGGKLPD